MIPILHQSLKQTVLVFQVLGIDYLNNRNMTFNNPHHFTPIHGNNFVNLMIFSLFH